MTYTFAVDNTVTKKSTSLVDIYKYLQQQLISDGKLLEIGVHEYSELSDELQQSYLDSKQLNKSNFINY